MTAMPRTLATYFADSVIETIGYAETGRAFAVIEEPEDGVDRLPLSAAITFSGDRIRGVMLLACTAAFLKASNPLKDIPTGEEDVYQRDWLGEAINLTLGAMKRKLVTKGLTVTTGTPYLAHYVHTTSMALEQFGEAGHSDGYVQDLWVSCEGANACFQLAAVTDVKSW